jgi:hypothetical protein
MKVQSFLYMNVWDTVKVHLIFQICKINFTNLKNQTPLFRYSPGDMPITFRKTLEK